MSRSQRILSGFAKDRSAVRSPSTLIQPSHARPGRCRRFGGNVVVGAVLAFLFGGLTVVEAAVPDLIVTPTRREPDRIAIPTFETDGSPVTPNDFHEIVYKDLEITGYFDRGRNQAFIEETHRRDRKTGKVDFPEWKRLEASFLLTGIYEVSGNSLQVTILLHYVPTGKRIIGKKYKDDLGRKRILAHRVSDAVFHAITHEQGIANTQILHVSTTDPTRQKREVWVMDADGANARQITNDNSLVATPCWGANATEIYYTSWRDYNPDLCGIYLKGGTSWFISRFPTLNVSPSWSQRRERIVLTLGKDGNSEIYVMDRGGKNLERLTHNRAIDSSPHWSPDGNDIVFTSNRSGSPQIYVMDAEGLNPRLISYVGSDYCDAPSWSPNGDKIAFTARDANTGLFDIYVVEVNGSNPVRLTQHASNNEDPCWAPNGLMLVFTSDRTGSSQIYIMNSDGSNQRRLTSQGYNTSPAWSPFLYPTQ